MMSDRAHVLWTSLRALAIEFLAMAEDYLGVPYDKSALAKRQEKVKK